MRFSADLIFKGSSPFHLPTSYKKNIASLFKEALKAADAESQYNDFLSNRKQNTFRPFTYSVDIPEHEKIETGGRDLLKFDDPEIQLQVSSSDSKFIMNLYNGLLKINNDFSLFKLPSEFRNIQLHQERSIQSESVLFRVLSPVIIMNPGRQANKKAGRFLCCKDKNFRQALYDSVHGMCKKYLDSVRPVRTNQIIIDSSKCSVAHVYHNDEIIPATAGYIHVSAPREVLKMIYDCGLGDMQSQGFGMVEILG